MCDKKRSAVMIDEYHTVNSDGKGVSSLKR